MGKYLTSKGSFFPNFRMQLPGSFKRTLQRDRTITPMNPEMHALMGSAIIGACKAERYEADDVFPRHLRGVSFDEILVALQDRFPFNYGLVQLILTNLDNDQSAQNINIVSLKEYGESAKMYINELIAFQPVLGEDIDEQVKIAQALWQEGKKHQEAIQSLSPDVPIKDLDILPPRMVRKKI
jgi:hypothetical protein